jgi:hypothetical protein
MKGSGFPAAGVEGIVGDTGWEVGSGKLGMHGMVRLDTFDRVVLSVYKKAFSIILIISPERLTHDQKAQTAA